MFTDAVPLHHGSLKIYNFSLISVIFLQVAWIKSDSKAILAIHTNMVALNPRLSVTYNNHNTWKLRVSNVQANDSGTYMCQVNTDPMKSQVKNIYKYIYIFLEASRGTGALEWGTECLNTKLRGSLQKILLFGWHNSTSWKSKKSLNHLKN